MESNVQTLLDQERAVNQKVQAALQAKNQLLKSIKKEAEIAVTAYKKELDDELKNKLREVS